MTVRQYEEIRSGELLTNYAVVDYWSEPNSTGDDLIKALRVFQDKYEWVHAYLPHDQPGVFKSARTNFGASKLKKAKTSVFSGISTVASFFNRDRLMLIKNKGYELAWNQITGYEWRKTKDGDFLDEPVKKDRSKHPGPFRGLCAIVYVDTDFV